MQYRESNHYRLFLVTLYAAPFWWMAGANIFVYHLAAYFLFFTMAYDFTRNDRGIYLPPSFYMLFTISVIYAFSLVVHASSSDTSRVIASAYNLSFWIMGWMLVALLANTFSLNDTRSLLRVFYWLALFLGCLAVLVFLVSKTGTRTITYPTLLYKPLIKILGSTPLIENSLMLKPLHLDWLASGTFPRFSALCPYSTATGCLLVAVLMMLIAWALVNRKVRSLSFWWVGGVALFALIMTLSRTAVLSFLVGFLLVFFLQRERPALWILLFFLGALVLGAWVGEMMEWLLNLREDSTVGRLELYKYSLAQLEGIDWVIGFGLKPREETAFMVPIGSHSTYLSMLFKTGLAGTAIFCFFQFQLILRWLKFRWMAKRRRNLFYLWRGLGGVFVGAGLWMFTGDIDAPQILAFIYFALVGVFEAVVKDEKSALQAKSD